MSNGSFFIIGWCHILPLVLIYSLGDGIRLIGTINLRDVWQDHDVTILVIIVTLPVYQIVINGVPLFTSSVERLAHRNLSRFMPFRWLNCKFLLIERLLLSPKIVTLSLILHIEVQRILLLTKIHLLLNHSGKLIATLHAHRLIVRVHRLNSLRVYSHLLFLRVRRVMQRRWDIHGVLHVCSILNWFLTTFIVLQWLRRPR